MKYFKEKKIKYRYIAGSHGNKKVQSFYLHLQKDSLKLFVSC